MDGVAGRAAGRKSEREGCAVGPEGLPRSLQLSRPGGRQFCKEPLIRGCVPRLTYLSPVSAPTELLHRNCFQYRALSARLTELAAEPEEGSDRSQRGDKTENSGRLEQAHSPHIIAGRDRI